MNKVSVHFKLFTSLFVWTFLKRSPLLSSHVKGVQWPIHTDPNDRKKLCTALLIGPWISLRVGLGPHGGFLKW